MRFLPVSLDTILVELAGLDETLALFASLEAVPVAGIVEMVPAARTLNTSVPCQGLLPLSLLVQPLIAATSARVTPSPGSCA